VIPDDPPPRRRRRPKYPYLRIPTFSLRYNPST
jgi:hypothetical protein